MKKTISFALAAALAFATPAALVACGSQGGAGGSDSSAASASAASTEFKTLADVLSLDTESMMSTFDEQRYVCAFLSDGTWWRVEAALPEGLSEELNEAWVDDEAKLNELLSPLAVTKADVLEAPSDEEVAALVGKTGADLTADGFTFAQYGLVVNGEETDATATKGDFDYLITFEGAVPDENTEDAAGAVADMTVTSAGIQSVSWTALEGEE